MPLLNGVTVEGVDYAWDRPTVSGLVAAGKRFVVRYGGPGSSGKQLDAAEAKALIGAGVAIVANAEGAADGLLGGRSAGIDWARQADAHFRALGMPADRPIYLSVDFDAGSSHWSAVDAALRGAAEVIGADRVGVYGGYDTIAHCANTGTARWFWQTYAWSGGRWHPRAHLQQYKNHVTLAGGTVDLCRAMVADYGQWGQGEDMLKDERDALFAILSAVKYTDGRVEAMASGRDKVAVHDAFLGDGSPVWLVQQIKALAAALAQLAGKDFTDEPAIVAGVLAGLSPEAIAAAIPPELARQVADELAARLQG